MINSGKRQNGFAVFEVLFFVLLVAVIAGGAYYVGTRHNNSDNSKVATTQPTKSSASSNSSSSTADWLTYKGSGYTLKYPKDWKFVAKGTMAGGGEFATDEFVPAANYPDVNAYILIMMHDTSTMTAKDYGNDARSNKQSSTLSTDTTSINGYDTFTTDFKVSDAGGGPNGHDIFIVNKGTVVEFTYYEDASEYVDTYKSIVRTIKFD